MNLLILNLLIVFAANAEVPEEISDLHGLSGTLASAIKAEDGLECTIEVDDSSVFIRSAAEFPSSAVVQGAEIAEENYEYIIFKTLENGRRPGGSLCGDFIPMFGFEKIVAVTEDSITIQSDFRCLLEKVVLFQTCNIQ